MSKEKQEKIKKLLAMQMKFIALDREKGVEASQIIGQMNKKDSFKDLVY